MDQMDQMDRMISLGVGTVGAEDYVSTFQDISELAKNLGSTHTYVSVSATAVGQDSDDESDELYYDENTLFKVRDAIVKGGFTAESAHDIINYIMNAGILFRELPQKKG